MIREILHFLRQAPAAGRMRRRLGPAEFLDACGDFMDRAGKDRWRQSLVGDLEGEVLEIGAGTGRMFPYYGEAVALVATEPEAAFLSAAAGRARSARAGVTLLAAAGEDLPFPDARFDAVVAGSVLCCVRSVERTLAEVRRVLVPGGRFRAIEHVRSERLLAGILMDLFDPLWLAVNGIGCHMNRRPRAALEAAGFEIHGVETFQIFAPRVPPAFRYELLRAVRR